MIKGLVHTKINYIINHSSGSKPLRSSFIFETQMKIYFLLMKSESFLTAFKAQKSSKDIIKVVHVTSVVHM